MLEIIPIAKSLWRSKTGPALIVIQLALTIAIVSNALFFIHQRAERVSRPTGIADNELIRFWMKKTVQDADIEYIARRDMEVLRAMPNVIDAVPISRSPLSGGGSSSGFQWEAGEGKPSEAANTFEITDRAIDTLGMKLIEGRNFRADEISYVDANYRSKGNNIIVTKKFADQMFPDETAIGKIIFAGGNIPLTIIGIVERMLGSWPNWDKAGNVVFFPIIHKEDSLDYLIRTRESERGVTMRAVVEKLRAIDNTRIVADEKTVEKMKQDYYSGDHAMIKILTVVVLMLIFVNALGIVGLTTFWVNQRRKQIGIRRALGATKAAISRYFIIENIILCGCAVVGGTMLSYLASDYMVRNYSLSLLPWPYIAATGVILMGLTVLAASLPAWRASQVSPSEATASV